MPKVKQTILQMSDQTSLNFACPHRYNYEGCRYSPHDISSSSIKTLAYIKKPADSSKTGSSIIRLCSSFFQQEAIKIPLTPDDHDETDMAGTICKFLDISKLFPLIIVVIMKRQF